jgi:hypothetical protein
MSVQVSEAAGSVTRLVSNAGVVRSIRHLVRTEGLGSLYCGIVPASIKVLPMAAASFGTYELVNSLLLSAQTEAEEESKKTDTTRTPHTCGQGAACSGGTACSGCSGGGGGRGLSTGGGQTHATEFCTTAAVRDKLNCASATTTYSPRGPR